MCRLALLLALATGLMVPSAIAAGEPSAAEKETARSLVIDGRQKLAAGDAQGALKTFQAAHPPVAVAPWVSPATAGVVAVGRF